MRHSSRSLAIALLSVATLVVPLGSVAAQSPAAPSPSAPAVPAASGTPAASIAIGDQRLADAVDATVATGAVRTGFSVVFEGSSIIPDETSISGSGQTNFGLERRMRLNLDMTAFELGVIDLIVDGASLYVRGLDFGDEVPADAWLRADLTSEHPLAVPLRSLASGNNDASLLLYFLLGATGPADVVGEEDIDGVATTHLRTTVDLDRALALVPEEMRETLAENIAEVREGGVDPILGADAWLDADGLVHRVVFLYTLGEVMGGGEMTATFDFRQHGEPLDLAIPAPEDTVDVETLS